MRGPVSGSDSPGVENDGVRLLVQKDAIEHVLRRDRPDARKERRLAVAVEGLQREAAGVDLAPSFMNLLRLAAKFWWPGNASSPRVGKPRWMPSVTPGP